MTKRSIRFEIEAEADAQTLARLINYFAQRDLTPSLVNAEQRGASMLIVIEEPTLEIAHATIIAEKMRASVLVNHVGVVCLPTTADDHEAHR